MPGIFVTGTDTDVGKTVVSSVLVAALRHSGRTGYWKPVQTGIEQDDDTAEVRRLARCSADEIVDAGIRLPRPLSPHLSARLAGCEVAVRDVSGIAAGLQKDRFWVVEGAGGILVPLNDREMMTDLIVQLGLPAVIASRSGLGTINHTLLTLAELRARSIPVAGVIMSGKPNSENRDAIERYGRTTVLCEIPTLRPLRADSIERFAAGLASRMRVLRDSGAGV